MLISSSKTKDLGKALMEYIGDCPEDPMKTYRVFLSRTLNSNVSHSNLSMLHQDLLSQFYRLRHPDKKPAEFDFWNASDVSKLERSISANIVLLGGGVRKGRAGEYTKLHDTRIFDQSTSTPRKTFSFVVEPEVGGTFRLLVGPPDYDVRLSEWRFIAYCSPSRRNDCLWQKVRDLAGGGEDGDAPQPPEDEEHEHDWKCNDPLAMCAEASRARELLPGPVLLASHVKGKLRGSAFLERQSFAVLGVLKRDSETLDDCTVICLTADRRHAYLPLETVARAVLDRTGMSGRGERREKFPPQLELAAAATEKKNFTWEHVTGRSCDCTACRRGAEFRYNMPLAGKQQTYRTRMSSFDLARSLGLLDEKTASAINEACRLSQAAWDVESMTVENEDDSRVETVFPFEQTSRISRKRKVLARQVPLLVSWADYAMTKEGAEPFVYEYDEREPEKMTARFLGDVVERREKASAAKEKLLEPLLSWCEAMEKAHTDHFLRGGGGVDLDEEEEGRVGAAFRASIFGKFQSGLKALVRRYILWAFNGEAMERERESAKVDARANFFFSPKGI